MGDQKKLVVRVGKSTKTGKLYFSAIYICSDSYQITLGFLTKDKAAEMLNISVRKIDSLECKDYEVM